MTTLTFKVSDEDARLIRALANQEQVTISEYLRRRAAGRIRSAEAAAPRRIRCRQTGAMIFAPLARHVPLSTHVVKELLADFP
jgi:hypothetical protein